MEIKVIETADGVTCVEFKSLADYLKNEIYLALRINDINTAMNFKDLLLRIETGLGNPHRITKKEI